MHTDRLGQEIVVDDIVVTVRYGGLALCKIIRFTPKMVKLCSLDNSGHWRVKAEIAAYATDMLKVDQQQAVIYLLKKPVNETN